MAKEKTAITEIAQVKEQQENGIANVISYNAVTFDVANFGYKSSKLERGENGGMMVKLKNEQGQEVETEVFVEDTSVYSAMDSFAKLHDFQKLEKIAQCYYIAKTAPLAKASGFKSVGAFLAMQYGIDSSTANNYRTIGEMFLEERPVYKKNEKGEVMKDEKGEAIPVYTENGEAKKEIVWKYKWCDNSTVSNLNQCLSLIRECKEPEVFFEQYVKTGKINICATLNTVKEQYNKVKGKDTAKKEAPKKGDNKPDKPIQSVRTLWATVKESISAYKLSDAELELFQSASRSIEQILEAHKPKQ